MNNKGFTLTELIGVLAILAIITIIATTTIMGVVNNSKEKMLEDKKMNIEVAAVNYVQNNNIMLDTKNCLVNGNTYDLCKVFTVKELLDKKELESEDKNNKFYNDVTGLNMDEDKVTVYRMNNRLYAKMTCMKSNNETC